jgi:hypothetical protein
MYKISRRINFSNGNIMQDAVKYNSPQEVIIQINKMLGIYAPINKKQENRILNMIPGDKVRFKIEDISVSVKYSK